MRSLIAVSLSLLVATACAAGSKRPVVETRSPPAAGRLGLPPITVEETPERCYESLERVNAPTLDEQVSGRIDLASCVADEALAPLELTDQPESVIVIDEMMGPAFWLLDEAMSRGDTAVRVAALRTKADIFGRMGTRMLATVAPSRSATFDAALQRERRLQIVGRMVEPWEERARQTHAQIVALGDAHPELLQDPAAQLAILDSERRLAIPIATRE